MSSNVDVESLQPTVRNSNKCVHLSLACLAFAVIVTWIGGAAVVVLAWNKMDMLNSIQPSGTGHHGATQYALAEADKFKSRHFTYLRASQDKIDVGTMKWDAIDIGNGSSIGANFDYDSVQRMLTVKREGSYFIYLNLNFTNVDLGCDRNSTVQVTLKSKGRVLLSCEVKLKDCPTVTERCWDVVKHLDRDSRISGDISVHGEKLSGWKLVSNDSGFGMFVVDSL
ncbi:uncharacterized protein LOC121718099 [Alosa sapidissima]|uniref:uncharacterized protein LOC121718099 n=1 Tax=Alosa sapidissima TaxID=34773 RepID=UPI001C086C8D|nr:uncharacterized protein LOC121718099 [Alosa sapidissima]